MSELEEKDFISEYINEYEFRDDIGYIPNRMEKFLIEDCIRGLIDEPEFKKYFLSLIPKYEMEVVCPECGGHVIYLDCKNCIYVKQDKVRTPSRCKYNCPDDSQKKCACKTGKIRVPMADGVPGTAREVI